MCGVSNIADAERKCRAHKHQFVGRLEPRFSDVVDSDTCSADAEGDFGQLCGVPTHPRWLAAEWRRREVFLSGGSLELNEVSLSTAARLCSGARCAYRIVIWMVLCPISAATVRMSTPAITRRLANVCRKQYHVKSTMTD